MTDPAPVPHGTCPSPRKQWDLRAHAFLAGDYLFFVLVGVLSTLTMHLFHQFEWPFVPTSVFGMIAAMVVQMLLAFLASPLLGSIETMVPSMVIGMVTPMFVCLLHLFGCDSTPLICLALGVAFGTGMFLYVQTFGRACRRYWLDRHFHRSGARR